ncbi:hypothetical protein [Photobacterium angustum]|uniref:hypothetical protein n=1 Tax=Photobacterium angustum TaxID=661 RepID=UPI0005DD0010|nr:hypothetical protein [Photobacterium angustum]KJG03914.1 hypothetical protein UB33_21675 [Photobacterium angustum]KJG17942.1 hypothetical protein UA33_08295 [Photobacterium angustum]KJG24601.1 hypothetical protein UA39_07855 [Photobacterium angustum]KJG32712.1 hypothetical protein UA36_04490 [Photobacterium angustum]PSV94067.1 hypothetical protein CTN01_08705 [Photobacterium angustum]
MANSLTWLSPPTEFNRHDSLVKQAERAEQSELAKEARAKKTLEEIERINAKSSLKHEQLMNDISGNGVFTGQCTLQEELEKNHQAVLLLTEEDSFHTIKNLIDDRYHQKGQIPSTLILKDIDKTKTWAEYLATGFGAVKLAQAFGDFGVTARYSVIKGKTRVSIASRNNGQQMLRHVLVNGMRLKVNGKKTYAIDNPKVVQLGLAPKQRISTGIKAGAMTMIISAAINTNDLIFNDDYDFYDWFGNIGADFIKTAIALYGTEIVVGAIIGLSGAVAIVSIAVISILLTLAIDDIFEVKNVSGELTNALRKLQS